LNAKAYQSYCKVSILNKEFDIQALTELLDVPVSEEINYLRKMQKEKIEKTNKGIKVKKKEVWDNYNYFKTASFYLVPKLSDRW
jgi:hypothetical protein